MNIEQRVLNRRHIVVNQHVSHAKRHAAGEMRRHMTAEEAMLWQAVKSNKLDGLHFRRQQIIDGFIVDFYCHVVGLIVEVDGLHHQDQAEYDVLRDSILSGRNLAVLRVTNEEVRRNLPAVLSRIATRAKERMTQITPSTIDHPLPCEGRGPGG